MPAPVFRTANTASGSSGAVAVNKPTGTVDGDLLILAASGDLSASENLSFTPPDGSWTELLANTRSHATNAGNNLQVWWKIASSEPASYSVTPDHSNLMAVCVARFDGHDGTDPFDTINITGFDTGTEAKIQSINTTVANCLIFGITTWDQSKTLNSIPGSTTQAYHLDVSGHDQHAIYFEKATAGATGDQQYDLSSSAPYVSAAIAIQPSQGGTNVTANADTQSKTLSLPAPSVTAIQNVSVSSGVLSPAVSVQAPTVTGGATVSPSPLSPAVNLGEPTVSTVRNVTVSPDPVSLSSQVQDPTVTTVRHVSVSAEVVSIVSSILSPSVTGQRNVSVSTDLLELLMTPPAPSVVVSQTVSPPSLSGVLSLAGATITAVRNITVSPGSLGITGTIIEPDEVGQHQTNVTVTPDTIYLGGSPLIFGLYAEGEDEDDFTLFVRLSGKMYLKL